MAKGRASPRKGRKPRSETIIWSDSMVMQLLDEASQPENAIVLRGKRNPGENTSGDTKKAVFERIAAVVLPAQYERDAGEAGKKVRSKYDIMCSTYHKKHSELRATGNGIGAESLSGDEGDDNAGWREQQLNYYIKPNGPDSDTPREAVNLWDKIVSEFKWFPDMHRLLCMRPNQVPIAITTGLGPSGPRTVLHQPPSRQLSPEWNLLDVPGSPEPAAGPSMRRSVQGATHPIHDHHSSDDSSDIEIFPPSSPPVAGKGKKVHPREHGPRANSSSKPTTVARGQGTSKAHMDAAPAVSGGGVVVKKEGMVKEEKTAVKVEKKVKETKETKEKEVKKTNPRASKKMPEPEQLEEALKGSSGGSSSNHRKRKSKEMDGFWAMQEDMVQRREKRDAQQAYMEELKHLLEVKVQLGLSNQEYFERENEIKVRYGRAPSRSANLFHPPSPSPARPMAVSQRNTNMPANPPFQLPPVAVPRRPSPELILVASSSPVTLSQLVAHPFGSPQKETTWTFDDDELEPLPPPVFPQGYFPGFTFQADELAPPGV